MLILTVLLLMMLTLLLISLMLPLMLLLRMLQPLILLLKLLLMTVSCMVASYSMHNSSAEHIMLSEPHLYRSTLTQPKQNSSSSSSSSSVASCVRSAVWV